MCGVMITQRRERLIELVLFDVAMRGEISTGSASGDEVFAREESQRACVIVVRKMDLR